MALRFIEMVKNIEIPSGVTDPVVGSIVGDWHVNLSLTKTSVNE